MRPLFSVLLPFRLYHSNNSASFEPRARVGNPRVFLPDFHSSDGAERMTGERPPVGSFIHLLLHSLSPVIRFTGNTSVVGTLLSVIPGLVKLCGVVSANVALVNSRLGQRGSRIFYRLDFCTDFCLPHLRKGFKIT